MLTLKSLSVSSFNVDQLTLTWEFKSTKESFSEYILDVYRSESPGTVGSGLSGYDLVASGIASDTYAYSDTSIDNLYDPFRKWYYKLDIKSTVPAQVPASQVQPETPAYVNDSSLDKVYKEILRRKTRILAKFTGRDLYILKRRTYGTYCTLCYDDVLFRPTDPACTECHGTGFKTGYFPAIAAKGMINGAPKMNQITMFGEFMPSDAILNILNYPPLRPRDVIVDNINRR